MQGERGGHITPNLLLQFDFTANVWVSRCPSGAALINVIIKECLFYFFKRLCLLGIQYDTEYFQRKSTSLVGLTVLKGMLVGAYGENCIELLLGRCFFRYYAMWQWNCVLRVSVWPLTNCVLSNKCVLLDNTHWIKGAHFYSLIMSPVAPLCQAGARRILIQFNFQFNFIYSIKS